MTRLGHHRRLLEQAAGRVIDAVEGADRTPTRPPTPTRDVQLTAAPELQPSAWGRAAYAPFGPAAPPAVVSSAAGEIRDAADHLVDVMAEHADTDWPTDRRVKLADAIADQALNVLQNDRGAW